MNQQVKTTLLKYLALAAKLPLGEALELEFMDEKEMKLCRQHLYRIRKEEGYESLSFLDKGKFLWLVKKEAS